MFLLVFLCLISSRTCYGSKESLVNVVAPWPVCIRPVDVVVEYVGQASSKQALLDFLLKGRFNGRMSIDSLIDMNSDIWTTHMIDPELIKRSFTVGSTAARLESLRQYNKVCSSAPCLLNSKGEQFNTLEKFVSTGAFHQTWPALRFQKSPVCVLIGDVAEESTIKLLTLLTSKQVRFAFQPIINTCKGNQMHIKGFGLSAEYRSGDYEKTSSTISEKAQIDFFNAPELKHIPFKNYKQEPVSNNIGLKLAAALQTKGSTFETLHSLLLNLPLARQVLSNLDVDEEMTERIRSQNVLFAPEFPLVSINGIAAQAENFDAFSVLRLLRILESYSDDQVSASALMKSWNKRKHVRFNIPLAGSVAWLNDIEKDDRYKTWIQDLVIGAKMQRTKPFKSIKRNMVTCLVLLDIKKADSMIALKNLQVMVRSMIPIRFGVIPINMTDAEISAFYSTLEDKKSVELAINAIEKPASKLNNKIIANYRQLLTQFDIGNLNAHVALINGRPLNINTDNMVEFKQSLFELYSGEVDWLFQKIQSGQLANSITDIYKFIMKYSDGTLEQSDQVFAPLLEFKSDERVEFAEERVYIKSSSDKVSLNVKGYKQVDCYAGSRTKVCADLSKEHDYIYYKGMLARISSGTTNSKIKLMEKYIDIQTCHLPKENVAKARHVESRLMAEIQNELRGLFFGTTDSPQVKFNFEGVEYGPKNAPLDISVIVNPISTIAQRIIAIAHAFQPFIKIRIVLNPHVAKTEFPMNSFYRFVSGDSVDVSIIPKDINLAFSVDSPGSWLLRQTDSNVDMDNTSLDESPRATFELKNLIVEGRALVNLSGLPAAGHKMKLEHHRQVLDFPVVMENNGYFQGKCIPGKLSLSVFDDSVALMPPVSIQMDRLDAYFLPLITVSFKLNELQRRQRQLDYQPQRDRHGDINIFTIASGHVYEHLAQIMITSVTANTNKRVKLWLVEAVSSAQLRKNMKILSEKIGFDLEFVDYKWPPWMFRKPIKTRSIKQYKMLFLDTMFPDDLERLIFVDADQVARADLYELYKMDLNEKVYAFTPFCESRKENEGFMFWKGGYWKNQLDGRPYHITAMFLVDLKRLRAFRTADHLRRQYQMFANDPNSLANEDQDLPNAIQHIAPIHSLPSHWLWCESWCADGREKEEAKIIDLCNNPAKKENKLVSARRIIPEWSKYDGQVKLLLTNENEKEDL